MGNTNMEISTQFVTSPDDNDDDDDDDHNEV